MKNSELFKLAAQCLNYDGLKTDTLEILNKVVQDEKKLLQFIHLCSNHLVLPAIFIRLKQMGLTKYFPEELAEHLNYIYTLNEKRNWGILQQIDEINNRLLNEGIEPVYLKGTGNLLNNVYSYIGERIIGDIDVLVHDKDYLQAAETLKKIGYKTDFKLNLDVTTFKHYPRLFREDVPADVEIHRVPVDIPLSRNFSTELIFKNKVAIPKKKNCFVPSDVHKIIHIFIHSQLSNQAQKLYISSLRDLYDAWLLSKRVDMKEVIEGIEQKEKALIFFNYIEYHFNNNQNLTNTGNQATFNYIKHHQWFLNHPRWHLLYIKSYKIYELIISRYIKRIFLASFSKNDRAYILNRIKDRNWYEDHFKGLRKHVFKK